ncbi:MAG: hypothetical protein A2Y02_02050 [Omnitrophica bacterium GWA2_52_12]|nr:MAG: hypothetical protein A2Y02_02050 [Omnitrophica bacterium GWA2_52_12]
MKNRIVFLSLLFLLSAGPAFRAFADTIQGTLKSVDENTKKMELDTARGFKSIAYTTATRWPAGTAAPSALVGKEVKVEQDDLLEEALRVEEI